MSNYPGQNIIIEYLKERGSKSTYCGFLNFNSDFITASIITNRHIKTYIVIKNKVNEEHSQLLKNTKRKNLAPAVTSHLNKTLNKTSDIKLSEISQPDSNETKKYVEQKGKLKRVRDDSNTDTESLSNEHWKKQSQILKQNKNNLAYVQVIDNALLVASAYENHECSLSSANEPVLQAIVENLLPLKYCIPELALVTNGKKPKGSGHFGYSDIFILNSEGDNNVILELKYISLVGLINSETLNNGLNKLNLYMETISKGKAKNYSSSGVFDDRVKITKSKPNKLKGFVILVIGFRRILWKSANEVTTNHIYNKI
ncbi:hypothetical protein GLOIN_2v1781418 [Rhizophagus irregularis DAOM 181602=DAOM 197198]|nr:hypothetical protein GLOIN_2v1781418 [Rhizophagus irregularis DAOM 181602=DAOM 197198]